MFPSVRALLAGIIDYAGLFPPATLPLDQAIRNYARYRQEPDAWMLGRFICPAARLIELEPFAELFQSGPPFVFSALGRGGKNAPELLAGLQADQAAIASFQDRQGERVVVDTLEVRLPAEAADAEWLNQAYRLIGDIAQSMAQPGPRGLSLFYEIPFGPQWGASVGMIAHTLYLVNASELTLPYMRHRAGFKLRCGGLERSAFPSLEQVAFTLGACINAGIPFKATAGLHHPIRRFDAELRTPMHGFLNLFVAGVLDHALRLNGQQMQAILEDEDPGHFVFDSQGLRWKDLCATTKEITRARLEAVTSFGSCSFDEARADLRTLGLLD